MQVSPALPWGGSEQQGGTITLQVPVTRQQLLDGALAFYCSYHGSEELCTIGIDGSSHKLVLTWNGGNYTIDNVTSDSDEYTDLTLVMNDPTTDGLTRVERLREVPAVEIYTDLECTQRPELGGVYDTLYAKFNKSYGPNEGLFVDWSGGNVFTAIKVEGIDESVQESNAQIDLYVDFVNNNGSSPYLAGNVYICVCMDEIEIDQEPIVNFGTTYV